MIKSKIIAAFPGTGKSTYYREHPNCLDSDSSEWSWLVVDGVKERHPEWPSNYINHIKENIDNEEIEWIFVSSHKEVRDALIESEITFNLLYPEIILKEDYLYRYVQRGSPESFVNLISKNWDNWLFECDEIENDFVNKIELQKNIKMEEIINNLIYKYKLK